MLGGVRAISDTGSLVVAYVSGSQIGPHASGAEKLILVVGTQKVVDVLKDALRRTDAYAFTARGRAGPDSVGREQRAHHQSQVVPRPHHRHSLR